MDLKLKQWEIEDNAIWWLNMAQEQEGKEGIFRAIIVNGDYVGNISVEKKSNVSCKDADIIYVLEIPRKIYRFRIVKRFMKRKLGIEKGKKESLRSLRDLLKWTDKFQFRELVN